MRSQYKEQTLPLEYNDYTFEPPPAKSNTLITSAYNVAMSYLKAGCSLIPLHSYTERPAVKLEEYLTRKPTEAELYRWFKTFGYKNLAVITGKISDLCVIGCDSTQIYRELCTEYDLKDTPTVKTPDEYLLFFRHSFEADTINKILDTPYRVNMYSNGDIVICPPSRYNDNEQRCYWLKLFTKKTIDSFKKELDGSHRCSL